MAQYISTIDILTNPEKHIFSKVIREVIIDKPMGNSYPVTIRDYGFEPAKIEELNEAGESVFKIIDTKKVIKEKTRNYEVAKMDLLADMFSAQVPAGLKESERRAWIESQVGLFVIQNDWLTDVNGVSRGILIYGLLPNQWEIYNEE